MHTITLERTVTEADTAAAIEPSVPPAASTPFILTLAESACHEALRPRLAEDEVSVGAQADIAHLAPSPVGARLVVTAVLVKERGALHSFDVEVHDEGRLVATVRHVRAIVPRAKIMSQLRRST